MFSSKERGKKQDNFPLIESSQGQQVMLFLFSSLSFFLLPYHPMIQSSLLKNNTTCFSSLLFIILSQQGFCTCHSMSRYHQQNKRRKCVVRVTFRTIIFPPLFFKIFYLQFNRKKFITNYVLRNTQTYKVKFQRYSSRQVDTQTYGR